MFPLFTDRFVWNHGEPLGSADFTNFHSSVEAQSHKDEDCVKIDRADSWQWKVATCSETRPFICQKPTCEHPPKIGPGAKRKDIESLKCRNGCPPFYVCKWGNCECDELFFNPDSKNCDVPAGLIFCFLLNYYI
ncbi:uncharacterized protein LOC144745069 [Ciona intestinalis]